MLRADSPFYNYQIKGTNFIAYDEGVYGLIFVDKQLGLARKIFKARAGADETVVRNTFQFEIKAYEIVLAHPVLKEVVPNQSHQLIQNAKGEDASCYFFPELAYEMEFVEGSFCKIGLLKDTPKLNELKPLFRSVGVKYLTDCSVCNLPTGLKFIDFATEEVEIWHD
ncbi:MAG: hypothetical protein ACPGVN_04270 [Alphaproteobacteria bacterium]